MNKDDKIEIVPSGRIVGSIRPPGSKSITNRALVCAALANGKSTLSGALDSDDTRVMIDSLGRLGISVEASTDRDRLLVDGKGGEIPAKTRRSIYWEQWYHRAVSNCHGLCRQRNLSAGWR